MATLVIRNLDEDVLTLLGTHARALSFSSREAYVRSLLEKAVALDPQLVVGFFKLDRPGDQDLGCWKCKANIRTERCGELWYAILLNGMLQGPYCRFCAYDQPVGEA